MGSPTYSTRDGPARRSGLSSSPTRGFQTPVRSSWANAGTPAKNKMPKNNGITSLQRRTRFIHAPRPHIIMFPFHGGSNHFFHTYGFVHRSAGTMDRDLEARSRQIHGRRRPL